jgi:uncharacterized membrane protein
MKFLWKTLWGQILMTFLISMVPIIELRGALPIATGAGLDWRIAIVVAIIGNLVPVPFIIIFIRKIFEWMHKQNNFLGRIAEKMEQKAFSKRETIDKYGPWGLWIFVAIPLPGTGAWTGALAASLFDMDKRKASLSIFGGVVGAGLIMTFGSQLVKFIVEAFV